MYIYDCLSYEAACWGPCNRQPVDECITYDKDYPVNSFKVH